MTRSKKKIIEYDINPLWLLHYLQRSNDEQTHIDTLYYTIRNKTKAHKFLQCDQLEAMLNYIGFQIDGNGYYDCIIRKKSCLLYTSPSPRD